MPLSTRYQLALSEVVIQVSPTPTSLLPIPVLTPISLPPSTISNNDFSGRPLKDNERRRFQNMKTNSERRKNGLVQGQMTNQKQITNRKQYKYQHKSACSVVQSSAVSKEKTKLTAQWVVSYS